MGADDPVQLENDLLTGEVINELTLARAPGEIVFGECQEDRNVDLDVLAVGIGSEVRCSVAGDLEWMELEPMPYDRRCKVGRFGELELTVLSPASACLAQVLGAQRPIGAWLPEIVA